MATIHGRNSIVYLGTGGVAITLTEANEWTLDISPTDEVDDGSFGDTWRTKLRGRLQFAGTVKGNFDTAQDNAFQAAIVQSASVKMYLYPDRSTATRYYYGNIWAQLSVALALGAKGTFQLKFDGDGQLAEM